MAPHLIILWNKWCFIASTPQRKQQRVFRNINNFYNASFSICISTGRIYNEASWDQATCSRVLSVSILRLTREKPFTTTFWKIFLTFCSITWNIWKYFRSKLFANNELIYQMNVPENVSVLSWCECWTRYDATEVWRSPALRRIHSK